MCCALQDLPPDSLGARSFVNHGIDVMDLQAFLRAFIGPPPEEWKQLDNAG